MNEGKSSGIRLIVLFLAKVGAAAFAAWLICTYVAGFCRAPSNDMFPNVKDGDLCIFNRLDEPFANRIVIYEDVKGNLRPGRVIAVPGQTIGFPENGGYTVDGYMQYETIPFVTALPEGRGAAFPATLREGEYFIMNDNRPETGDSRTNGPVSRERIKGTVFFLLRGRGF